MGLCEEGHVRIKMDPRAIRDREEEEGGGRRRTEVMAFICGDWHMNDSQEMREKERAEKSKRLL